ncbi:SH3-like domain-containing protein [Aureitalea sp. L0-47]|uniref:GW dipeptide domain-containing protein n=1 Tax=Aureitalea sp. L0-47 TaxID=2816962 RepID=UPI002237820B|nr:GW dipeptide domain-containing protein [Aureitalea sp. L0-47]MCW5520634.1 SH3-like domain-containing protein [Aureitalea sp. L0-47]
MKNNMIYTVGAVLLILTSCNNSPKVITAKSSNEGSNPTPSGIFSETTDNSPEQSENRGSFTEDLHKVMVKEVLPATKYTYLKVTEGGEDYWIAIRKQAVSVGSTYFYRNGLLKTNFESKEYNRVFDRIFLVSSLVPENHGNNAGSLTADFTSEENVTQQKQDIPTHTDEVIQHKGSVKIAEIVANPSSYEGKTVQITGKCVKINPNIMQRNWIHLQDGSKDDFDLVVTSNTFVPEGKVVTIKAKVVLNKDFGAGYRYDLILEEGVVIE